MGLPAPDLVLYLDMRPQTARRLMEKRYHGDESKKDIHEADFSYLMSCREAALNTISGETDLTLPAQGGTVRFDTASGAFITQRAYQKQDHFYGFGPADCKISVSSTSGDLEIE